MALLLHVLDVLCEHPFAHIFTSPVPMEDVPGYAAMIKRPMDIGTVQEGNDDSESVSSLDFFHLKCLVACAAAYSSQG